MATKIVRLTHKIAIQHHLVAESCTICSSRARRPVRKLLNTFWYRRTHRNENPGTVSTISEASTANVQSHSATR
jgi:hypothetical protein